MRRTFFAVGMLIVVPLSAAFAQGGGTGNAMSPVGMWDAQVVVDGAISKALVEFHFGGTAKLMSPFSTSIGTWETTGDRTFVVSFYTIISDDEGVHIGYFKSLVENTLVDKDTIQGRTEGWLLLGTDLFDPNLIKIPVFVSEVDLLKRLRAEGPS
jgi:hypothetical protein